MGSTPRRPSTHSSPDCGVSLSHDDSIGASGSPASPTHTQAEATGVFIQVARLRSRGNRCPGGGGGSQSHRDRDGRARTQACVLTPGPILPTHPHPQAGSHSRPRWDTGPFSPPASLAKGPPANGRVKATHQDNPEKLLLSCPAQTDNGPASLARIQRQDKGSRGTSSHMTFTELPGKDTAKSKARVSFPGSAARETRPEFLSQWEPQPPGP